MTIDPLKEGKKAPSFHLSDRTGEKFRLTELLKTYTHLVLFFYPKDSTPGCTVEATGFSKQLKKFEKMNALPIGISGGDDSSKEKFCAKNDLKVLLLSDSDFSIAKKYRVFGPKKFMGKTYDGIQRTTFIINQKQKIVKVFPKVKPPTHPDEVLDTLKQF